MTRQGLAFVGIAFASSVMLIHKWVLDESYPAPWYFWLPLLAVLAWSVWQLRERPDPNSKLFDFNPKRGAFYFILGFLIFPFMLGIDAVFGTDITMAETVFITIGGSIFIGLVGIFTEHFGV
jgi:cytochrome c biogenesis protein CcdA